MKRGSTPGIQTLKRITPTAAPRIVRRSSVSTRTYMVGRLPTVAGWPASARRSTDTPMSRGPSTNISEVREPCGPRSLVSTILHTSTCRSRSGIESGSRERSSVTGMSSIERSRQPGLIPAAAAPPFASTCVTSSSEPTSRTSKPGSPLRSVGGPPVLPRPDGISAKCDKPSRPSMSRMTSRSSPSVCARAARGANSARTAGQSTPFIVGSKCESRMMVHAASNVSIPLAASAGAGVCAAGAVRRTAAIAIAPSRAVRRRVT